MMSAYSCMGAKYRDMVVVRLLTLGAHAQRGLQYSVCVCVCYLANCYAVNVQVQSKIRIESKCGTERF